jgi:hypothetical protein
LNVFIIAQVYKVFWSAQGDAGGCFARKMTPHIAGRALVEIECARDHPAIDRGGRWTSGSLVRWTRVAWRFS